MFESFLTRVLATELVKKIALIAVRELAKRTDNTVDDQIVAAVEQSNIFKSTGKGA